MRAFEFLFRLEMQLESQKLKLVFGAYKRFFALFFGFKKTQRENAPKIISPSTVEPKQLRDLHIELKVKK